MKRIETSPEEAEKWIYSYILSALFKYQLIKKSNVKFEKKKKEKFYDAVIDKFCKKERRIK